MPSLSQDWVNFVINTGEIFLNSSTLRKKLTAFEWFRYNITPWNAEGSGGGGSSLGSRNRMRLFYSDDEEADDEESEDVEERKAAVATAFGLATSHVTSVFRSRRITDNFFKHSGNNDKEKLQLDIAALRMQVAYRPT